MNISRPNAKKKRRIYSGVFFAYLKVVSQVVQRGLQFAVGTLAVFNRLLVSRLYLWDTFT